MAFLKTRDVVSRYRSSGLPQRVFCAKIGIGVSTLQYHLKRSKTPSINKKPRRSVHKSDFISLTPATNTHGADCSITIVRGSFSLSDIHTFLHETVSQ